MIEDQRNLLARLEIMSACMKALDDREKLFQVCADVSGGVADARSAVAQAFAVSDTAADAMLAMQVKRFTPKSIKQSRDELADLQGRLADFEELPLEPSG